MNVGEWIEARNPPVPEAFRPYLQVQAGSPVSLRGFLAAADAGIRACLEGDPKDQAAAFSLLAADAYITYACLWTLSEGGTAEELRKIARRTAELGGRQALA